MTRIVLAFAVAIVLAGCARVETTAPQFHLEWEVTHDARGAAVLRGQVKNPYAVPARDIHLLAEGLDASDVVVTTTTNVLRRIVLSGDRAPFDMLVPEGAVRYRVSVV